MEKKLFEFLMKMSFLDTLITQKGSSDSEIYSTQDSECDGFSKTYLVDKQQVGAKFNLCSRILSIKTNKFKFHCFVQDYRLTGFENVGIYCFSSTI